MERIVTSGEDVKMWSSLDYSLLMSHKLVIESISDLSWSMDDQYLACLSSNGKQLSQLLVKDKMVEINMITSEDKMTCIKYANTRADYILTGAESGQVSIFDTRTRKARKSFLGSSKATSVCWSYNDEFLVSGNSKGAVSLFNCSSDVCTTLPVKSTTQAIRCLEFSKVNRSILGGTTDDGALNLWDWKAGKQLANLEGSHIAPVTGIAFSAVNEMLVCTVGLDKQLIFWDVKMKKALQSLKVGYPLTCIEMLPDSTSLLVGTNRGKVLVYDMRSLTRPASVWQAHNGPVHRVLCKPANSGNTSSTRRSSNKRPRCSSVASPSNVESPDCDMFSPIATTVPDKVFVKEEPAESNEMSNRSVSYSSQNFSAGDIFSPLGGESTFNGANGNMDMSTHAGNIPYPSLTAGADDSVFDETDIRLAQIAAEKQKECAQRMLRRRSFDSSVNLSFTGRRRVRGLGESSNADSPRSDDVSSFIADSPHIENDERADYSEVVIVNGGGGAAAAAVQNGMNDVVDGGAQVFHAQYLTNAIKDILEDHRERVHGVLNQHHCDTVRDQVNHEIAMEEMFKRLSVSVIQPLVHEVQKLRQEVNLLRQFH